MSSLLGTVPSFRAGLAGATLLLASALAAQGQGYVEGTFGGIVHPQVALVAGPDVPAPPKSITGQLSPHPTLPVPLGTSSVPPLQSPPTTMPQPGPLSPGDWKIFANETVRPTGASLSSTGEPSAAINRDTAFQTGNWYAALSRDSGISWTHVNPYTQFPASDGGFCCDQRVLYVPSHDLMVWVLQYVYSGSTQTNRYRIAIARGRDNLRNSVWYYYDFTPQNFGFPLTRWVDFPDLAASSQYLYLSTNCFDQGSNNIGSAVWRMSLNELRAGGGVGYWYWDRPFLQATGNYRLSQGANSRMYWASHMTNAMVRVYYNDQTSSGVGWYDRFVAPWLPGPMNLPGPDGREWLGQLDNRILGAYATAGEVGFLWSCGPTPGFRPRPYTRISRYRVQDLTVLAEDDIWNTDFAFVYPCAAVNSRGKIGGTIAWGGNTWHPSLACFLVDDYRPGWAPLDWYIVARGTHGPGGPRWGDYFTVTQHPIKPETFIATGLTQQGGPSQNSSAHHFVWFGREQDEPAWINLNVASNQSGMTIALDAADRIGQRNGQPPFARVYAPRQGVTLTAPLTYQSLQGTTWLFHEWIVNTMTQPQGQNVTTIDDMGTADNHTVAWYRARRRLDVFALNGPPGGTYVYVNPPDHYGSGDGFVPMIRYYRDLTLGVQLTAQTFPQYPFRRWRLKGADQPQGQLTLTLDMRRDNVAEAVYWIHTPGTFTSFGTGCGGIAHLGQGLPETGSNAGYLISGGPANGLAFLIDGWSRTSFGGIPLPIAVAGAPGCSIYTDIMLAVAMNVNSFGNAFASLPIPNDLNLLGAHFYTQVWGYTPGANPVGFNFSAAIDATIGGLR